MASVYKQIQPEPSKEQEPDSKNMPPERIVILSSLVRKWKIVDAKGAEACIRDMVVDPSAEDRAPIAGLMVQGKKWNFLPWDEVTRVDVEHGRIEVSDLAATRDMPQQDVDDIVLICRDIQDSLVLNLRDRIAMRANDLALAFDEKHGWLVAIDTSAGAVIRRFGRDRLNWFGRKELVGWKYIEFLRGNPKAASQAEDYHKAILNLLPVEIARLSDNLPYLHTAELICLLPDPIAADVLEELTPDRRLQVVDEIGEEKATKIIAEMAPDAATDLLGALPPGQVKHILESLPRERADPLVTLLRYPEDCAGGIMTTDVLTVPAQATIGEAMQLLRDKVTRPDLIYFVYVVDDAGHLVGMLTLRNLLAAKPNDHIGDVMQKNLITIYPLETAQSAAQCVVDNHLLALPVVSKDRQLLGMVTVDAATELLLPQTIRDRVPRIFS